MNTHRFAFTAIVATFCAFAFTLSAQAQASRTWVSASNGDDAAPCSRSAPCLTFSGAISKTFEGGEIDAITPGGYSTLTINKAITIDGGTGQGWASILVQGGSGFTVNVATSGVSHPNSAVVIIRNVSFNGVSQGPGSHGATGIDYMRADRLYVEHCVFENFTNAGIDMSLTEDGSLWMNDCRLDKTTSGLSATTTTGFAVVNIDHCRFNGMTNGVKALANSFATIRDSYFGGLTGATFGGVAAQSGGTANVENCMFANDTVGVSLTGGTMRLSNNDFFNNGTAISGGTAASANNNRFAGNTSDGATTNSITVK